MYMYMYIYNNVGVFTEYSIYFKYQQLKLKKQITKKTIINKKVNIKKITRIEIGLIITITIENKNLITTKTYTVINIKTDPELKRRAAKIADELGISISAVVNNELRRFVNEQSVVFEKAEVPNMATRPELRDSKAKIEAGDYYKFEDNEKALEFLAQQLK